MNELLNNPEDPNYTEYEVKVIAAIHSLVRGYDGPPLPAERVFEIWQYNKKKKSYCYLYGYCKQPFPDLKLKSFELRTSGIVYCDSMISINEMNLDGGEKRAYSGICADAHDAIIPFNEFVSGDQDVFELINGLARQNIYHRPVFVEDGAKMWPFVLLEDCKEAGGSIDKKSITADYLASKVREYTQIRPGKIMSSSFQGKRKPISVRELISRYYAPSLEKHHLQLRPHLLGWLKEKMEERLDSCEYAMWYADDKEEDNKEAIKTIHETILKYRKDPDNKGTAKLLAEDIAAAKYILKMIDRSFTIPEKNPVAIRDCWKVLLLDDFHLGCLKEYLQI